MQRKIPWRESLVDSAKKENIVRSQPQNNLSGKLTNHRLLDTIRRLGSNNGILLLFSFCEDTKHERNRSKHTSSRSIDNLFCRVTPASFF